MDNMEGKAGGIGAGARNLSDEARNIANEAEKFGRRMADKVGGAVGAAGEKIDEALDYCDSTGQAVRESFERIREEGFQGLRQRTLEYTRKEPLTALVIAVGAGILLGWMTKRGRSGEY